MVAAARTVSEPDQRRSSDQAAGKRRESYVVVTRHRDDFTREQLQQQSPLGAEQHAVDALDLGAISALDADALANVPIHQFFRAHQIELEVLFQHPSAGRVGQRGETHGGRVDQPGNVRETHLTASLGHRHLALVAHQRVARQTGCAVARQRVDLDLPGLRRTLDGQRVIGIGGARRGGDAHGHGRSE